MITSTARTYYLYKIVLFLMFIYGIHPWFFWGIDHRVVLIVAIVIFAYVFARCKNIFNKKCNFVRFIFLFALIVWMQKQTFGAILYGLGVSWILYNFLCINDYYKKDIINFITKWFSIMLLISLIGYIAVKLDFPLPNTVVAYDDSSSYNSMFRNYYFFIEIGSSSMRFSGIFLEPGYMAMAICPLLYLNNFDIRSPYIIILLISLLFSFSLAGYVVTALAYIYVLFVQQNMYAIKRLFISVFAVILFILIASQIFHDEIFSTLILDRLNSQDGNLIFNERINTVFAEAFNKFINSNSFYWGTGEYDAEEFFYGHGNAGWQVFTYMYGLVGLILCILAYISPVLTKERNKQVIGFSLLLLLLLYVNAYPTLWHMLILITIGTSSYFSKNKS